MFCTASGMLRIQPNGGGIGGALKKTTRAKHAQHACGGVLAMSCACGGMAWLFVWRAMSCTSLAAVIASFVLFIPSIPRGWARHPNGVPFSVALTSTIAMHLYNAVRGAFTVGGATSGDMDVYADGELVSSDADADGTVVVGALAALLSWIQLGLACVSIVGDSYVAWQTGLLVLNGNAVAAKRSQQTLFLWIPVVLLGALLTSAVVPSVLALMSSVYIIVMIHLNDGKSRRYI